MADPDPGASVGNVVSSAKIRFSLLDLGEDVVGQDIKFKAELTHPLSHQLPVKLNLVAGIDCLLPIERKAIGILKNWGQGHLGSSCSLD